VEGFSWTISGATIIVVLGWASTVGAFIWSRSRDETTQRSRLESAHKRLDGLEKRLDGMDTEMDMRVSTLQASSTLLREQQHELRQELARNYMTRAEIGKIEERVHEGQNRIVDRMDKIDERIGTMQDKILAAIHKSHPL
jgi:tetrahydromethanopterin S-methyltransferase subunit G